MGGACVVLSLAPCWYQDPAPPFDPLLWLPPRDDAEDTVNATESFTEALQVSWCSKSWRRYQVASRRDWKAWHAIEPAARSAGTLEHRPGAQGRSLLTSLDFSSKFATSAASASSHPARAAVATPWPRLRERPSQEVGDGSVPSKFSSKSSTKQRISCEFHACNNFIFNCKFRRVLWLWWFDWKLCSVLQNSKKSKGAYFSTKGVFNKRGVLQIRIRVGPISQGQVSPRYIITMSSSCFCGN